MVMTMTSMTVMHEDMHQRAGQQQQERQRTDDMSQVLRQQEIARDRPHDDQADGVARTPETGRDFRLSMVMIHGDRSSSWQ